VFAQGGYLCRLEALDARVLRVAREAFEAEGELRSGAALHISVIPRRRVVRLAYEAPHLTGERGARWYDSHPALAQMLSRELAVTVHSYVLLPGEFEQVSAYGAGRRVGGDRLRYEDVEIDGLGEGLDEVGYERLKSRWPLGHLAYVFGVTREALLNLPWKEGYRVALDGQDGSEALSNVLPPPAA